MQGLLGQGLQVNLCHASVCTVLGIPQSTWSYVGHDKRSKGYGRHLSKDGGEPLKRCPVPKRGCDGVGIIRAAEERTSASAASQSTGTGRSEMKLARDKFRLQPAGSEQAQINCGNHCGLFRAVRLG